MDPEKHIGRKSRKSAPVKNNTFIGFPSKKRKNSLKCFDESRDESPSTAPSTKRQNRADRSISKSRVRYSTPVRGCETEPRNLRSKRRNDHNLSNASNTSLRRFNPNYDPNIEIRRAKERFDRYQSTDWADDLLLEEDASEDLKKYEAKIKKRLTDDTSNPFELEKRMGELRRRQKDIDLSKISEHYAEYIYNVPKPERLPYHPVTPNKFRKLSRRAWDGIIRKWRIHLHNYDSSDFNASYRSDASSVGSVQSTEFSFSMDLPEPEIDYQIVECEGLTDNPIMLVPREVNLPDLDDEETLQGNNQENIAPLRRYVLNFITFRSSRQKSGSNHATPVPEMHCGLTNDMLYIGPNTRQRTRSGDKNIVASPSKRQRVTGVLAEHGQLKNPFSFTLSDNKAKSAISTTSDNLNKRIHSKN